LKWLFRSGQIERAGCLFDEIPVRDVTWKMIISGYFRHALITGSNTTLPKFVIRRVQIILFYFKELFWKKKKKSIELSTIFELASKSVKHAKVIHQITNECQKITFF
jgi:hypothetical protein